ncbi:MAG: cobyrinate a,c-diamide synthase [Elainellaceae cyanobacterium]
MALIIAGDRSGVGKTTVTLSLLACLRQLFPHQQVQSFKVGPDYIDPMFHAAITGRACRNLDPVLTSEGYVQRCFTTHSKAAHYALIEGVMGLFDGAGATDTASTAHIAKLLGVPVLLVLDAQRTSRSLAAVAHGFRSFDPEVEIAGVVLNRVGSDRHQDLLTEALRAISMPVLGVLRRNEAIAIPSRHLGLVPSGELTIQPLIDQLVALGKSAFNWDRLTPLLACSDPLPADRLPLTNQPENLPPQQNLRLAIASDNAFNFYYADNLDLLSRQADIVYWSPLRDNLPDDIHGLYLGGGFPELFAAELAANGKALVALRQRAEQGLPIYAECGGLMYLCQTLTDLEGQRHAMAGLIPAAVSMGSPLTLGYRRATAIATTPMVSQGAVLWGHEFHHSRLCWLPDHPPEPTNLPEIYALQRFDGHGLPPEGYQTSHIHASYVHLHWGATPHLPQQFLQWCDRYADQSQC